MPETKTIPVYLTIDENGDRCVHLDLDEVVSNHIYEHGENGSIRVCTINVTLTLPEHTEASVTVPDEAGQVVTATAAE